jgi:hypothetical protein
MRILFRLYLLLLISASVGVLAGCLVCVAPTVHLVFITIPLVLLVLFVVLTVEFSPDAESRGELESLLGLKRGGVLLRHAGRVGARRSRTGGSRNPSSQSDSALDRLVGVKRSLPPKRRL